MRDKLFDSWIDRYDSWFETPVGKYVKHYESALLEELVNPEPGERILDVGCGTGLFTQSILKKLASIIGVDLSAPMLQRALVRNSYVPFLGVCCDMCALPFEDEQFDKTYSMTAIEFVEDAALAISELERVTKKNGIIILTTLNSLSPWAEKRKVKAQKGHTLFQNIFFRSPSELCALVSSPSIVKTAIHFQKDTPLAEIPDVERRGQVEGLDTGAFLAMQWKKT